MDLYNIYNAGFEWKNCEDVRPWIIIGPRIGECMDCFPISGHCYDGFDCFELDPNDPNFAATGLTKRCFVHYTSIVQLPIGNFHAKRGALENQMLHDFINESGL